MKKYKRDKNHILNHSIGSDIGHNTHIKSAENMYSRLCDVKAGMVPFMPQDLSMVANCLELYYKELAIIKKVPMDSRLLNDSHSLYSLAKEIEKSGITLCSGGKGKQEWFREILHDLQDCYIATKYYGHEPDSGDFREAMKFLKKQREVVLTILDPTKSWNKQQNTIVMGSIRENADNLVEEDARER